MATMESINAKANAGLATGIVGTSLGAIANGILGGNGGGILGNILGNQNPAPASDMLAGMALASMSRPYSCESDHNVTRYEAGKDARIAELETEIKLRDANIYTDSKIADVYARLDAKIGCLENQLCDQKVYNATNTAVIGCIQSQVAQLMGLTKLVVPNGSICPGWGNVTITPAAAPAVTA
jgi:hypothetical protein